MSDSDNIYPPRKNTTAKANQQRIAVSAVNAQTALAPNLAKNGWVRVKAVGVDIDFTIDEVAGTLVKDATGSGTTVGYTLLAGQSEDFFVALTGAAGFVTTIASGAGFLLISRAGKERINAAGL
jgi:hypothetical protein